MGAAGVVRKKLLGTRVVGLSIVRA